MSRAFPLLLLAAPAACLAAPVPKQAEERDAVVRRFGTLHPGKDSEFVVDGQKLVARMPKPTPHNNRKLTFPHTLREASGDFAVTVVVSYPLPEKVPPLGGGDCAAGGLLIWADEHTHVLYRRHHQPCGLADGTTRWDTNFRIEFNRRFPVLSQHHQNAPGIKDAAPIHLRLTRRDGVVSTAYSFDGAAWKDQQPGPMDLPEKVMVGVFAMQTAGPPAAVTFEAFTVTPARPKD